MCQYKDLYMSVCNYTINGSQKGEKSVVFRHSQALNKIRHARPRGNDSATEMKSTDSCCSTANNDNIILSRSSQTQDAQVVLFQLYELCRETNSRDKLSKNIGSDFPLRVMKNVPKLVVVIFCS